MLPYHLSVPTQEAGRLALEWSDEMADRVARLVAERERVLAALRDVARDHDLRLGRQLRALPRARQRARRCGSGSSSRGVLVRDCSSWPRLAECLRVTIGTPAENDAFLDALQASIGEVAP